MFHLSIECGSCTQPTHDKFDHPLLDVLASVYEAGSIGKAAKNLGRSYRYVWGELKHWESVLNIGLVVWGKNGKGAELTPPAIAFLVAVSKTQTDLAPHVAHIKNCFEQCVSALQRASVAPLTPKP